MEVLSLMSYSCRVAESTTATLADSLRALDVPVDVIVDIDVLNDETVLRKIVESLGGDFSLVAVHAQPLKTAIESHKPWLTAGEVVREVRDIIDQAPLTGEFTKALKARVDSVFRQLLPGTQ
jgi:hypothetical protein